MSHEPQERPAWRAPLELDPDQLETRETKANPRPQARELDEALLSEPQPQPSEPPPGRPLRSGLKRLFSGGCALLVVLLLVSESYRLLDWGYGLHTGVGIGLSLLLLLVVGSGGCLLWRGLNGVRQLRARQPLRQRAEALIEARGRGQAAVLLQQLERQLEGSALAPTLREAINEVDSVYEDGEIIRFVSRHGFSEADRRALERVSSCSLDTALLVGFSPFAAFDMLLAGWRNWKMLNQIAECYGVAPGIAGQWHLLRRIVHQMAFVGASEVAIDHGGALLGTSLGGQLSARAGQGLGAGLITARIGLKAIDLCRPLPFERERRPRIGHIGKTVRRQLLARLSRAPAGDDDSSKVESGQR